MSATILQINFSFEGSWEEYESGNAAGAAQIAAIPGLGWKVWLKNAATSEAGGLYLFHDESAAQGFAAQAVIMLKELRGVSNVSIKEFAVIESLTAITRGPIAPG